MGNPNLDDSKREDEMVKELPQSQCAMTQQRSLCGPHRETHMARGKQ